MHMRQITTEQADSILKAIYHTNISVSTFDSIRDLLLNLPEVEAPKKEEIPEEK